MKRDLVVGNHNIQIKDQKFMKYQLSEKKRGRIISIIKHPTKKTNISDKRNIDSHYSTIDAGNNTVIHCITSKFALMSHPINISL